MLKSGYYHKYETKYRGRYQLITSFLRFETITGSLVTMVPRIDLSPKRGILLQQEKKSNFNEKKK